MQGRPELLSLSRRHWLCCVGSLISLLAITLGALAQGASPQNLNDCTFLREPDQLKRCVDENQGLRLEPEVDQQSPPPPGNAGTARGRVSPPRLLKDEGKFNEHVEPPRLLKDEGILK